MRIGVSKTWKSLWYNKGQSYSDQFLQDLKIKDIVKEAIKAAGVDDIIVRRSAGKIEVEAFVARPGVAIGRSGQGIEELSKKLKKLVKADVQLKVSEVKNPDLSARIIANEIANGIVRRVPPKVLALGFISKARAAGAKGIRVWVSGRINGAPQARTIKHWDGPVPLHTIKADIDYAHEVAQTKDLGKLGVKVWIYQPDKKSKQ